MAKAAKRFYSLRVALMAGCAWPALILPAHANPQGGVVVSGQGQISTPAANEVRVTQSSDTLIVKWDSFDIAKEEVTRFVQPSTDALAVNRIGGNDPSQIMGTLSANGRIILINPNGVLFGDTARVNVNSLVATTHDIADEDVRQGRLDFDSSGKPTATIENRGAITASGGSVAFVAPGVSNSGRIVAKLGKVTLAGASKFTLDFEGDDLVTFPVDAAVMERAVGVDGRPVDALVSNSGTIEGSTVVLSAQAAGDIVANAINIEGSVIARSASRDGGDIVLGAGDQDSERTFDELFAPNSARYNERQNVAVTPGGTITVDGGDTGSVMIAGDLSASGTAGGRVTVTGNSLHLTSSANIDATGIYGGGTVLIGGDYQGRGALRHARRTVVDEGAVLSVDALLEGDGGTIVLWSTDQTQFAGHLSARGGNIGGSGGVAEVSSKGNLRFFGTVDLTAASGQFGSLLLDPRNLTIADTGASPTIPASPDAPITLLGTADDSVLSISALLRALEVANVTVATGSDGTQEGNLTVATNINWDGSNSLTLSAHGSLNVNNDVTIANTGSGNLTLRSDSDGSGVGTVVFNGTGKVDFNASTGTVSIFYNPASNPAGSAVNSTSYAAADDFSSFVLTNGAVPNQLAVYMLVNSVFDLQNIENNLGGMYAIGRNIDASVTDSWNGGAGFIPISSFTGVLDGQGHSIDRLTINSTGSFSGGTGVFVGLFARIEQRGSNIAAVRNLSLTNLSVSGTTTFGTAGLVGWNLGLIDNVRVTGAVTGVGQVGGLVGNNSNQLGSGIIQNSQAAVAVTGGTGATGGLVGENTGTIIASFATGEVRGGGSNPSVGGRLGGLAGENQGTIRDSYATGSVNGGTSLSDVGGLVGFNWDAPSSPVLNGEVIDSYATGTVSGGFQRGGLVARSFAGGSVTTSYWDAQTTGQALSAGGIGLTTAQLKAGVPDGFDAATWAIDPTINDGYPYLRWQIPAENAPTLVIEFGKALPSQASGRATSWIGSGQLACASCAGSWWDFLPFLRDGFWETIIGVAPGTKILDVAEGVVEFTEFWNKTSKRNKQEYMIALTAACGDKPGPCSAKAIEMSVRELLAKPGFGSVNDWRSFFASIRYKTDEERTQYIVRMVMQLAKREGYTVTHP